MKQPRVMLAADHKVVCYAVTLAASAGTATAHPTPASTKLGPVAALPVFDPRVDREKKLFTAVYFVLVVSTLLRLRNGILVHWNLRPGPDSGSISGGCLFSASNYREEWRKYRWIIFIIGLLFAANRYALFRTWHIPCLIWFVPSL